MNFSKALEEIKKGKKVKLKIWTDDVFISAQYPDEHSKMTHPYLYVSSRHGIVPWIPTQVELFSEDWSVKKYYEMPEVRK